MPDWRFWEEGPYAAGHDVSDRESYLALVYRLGSTPNGVFGAKIHWNCLRWALAKFSEMPRFAGLDRAAILRAAFPDLRVVDVTRRDRVRQAVSWARMAQDGMWVDPVGQPEPAWPPPTGPPRYDYELIAALEALIAESERDRLAPAVRRAPADALPGRLRGAEHPRWLRANDPGRAGSSRTRGLPGPDPGPPDAPSIQRPERGLGSRLPRGQDIPPGALTRPRQADRACPECIDLNLAPARLYWRTLPRCMTIRGPPVTGPLGPGWLRLLLGWLGVTRGREPGPFGAMGAGPVRTDRRGGDVIFRSLVSQA